MSAVEKRTPQQELMSQVRSPVFAEQIEAALPEGIPPRRFVRTAVTALIENPDLVSLDRNSVFGAILRSAADGLLPDGREAALVPFKGKAVYIPMVTGYRKIAGEYGWSLTTAVVYEADEFSFELGLEPHLTHRRARPGIERGEIVAAYAVARHRDHEPLFEVMYRDEIEKVRKTSRSADKGPWVDWYERMAEKTPARRLFSKLPLGDRDRIQRILNADDLKPGEATAMLYGPDQRAIGTASEAPNGGATDEAATAPPPETPDSEEPDGSGGAEQSFEGDEPPAAASQFKAPDPTKEVVAAGLVEITFGRHAGRTIADIFADDPGYVSWMCTDSMKDEKIKAAAQRFLKGQDS